MINSEEITWLTEDIQVVLVQAVDSVATLGSIILICNLLMRYLDNSLGGKTLSLASLMMTMISSEEEEDLEVWEE